MSFEVVYTSPYEASARRIKGLYWLSISGHNQRDVESCILAVCPGDNLNQPTELCIKGRYGYQFVVGTKTEAPSKIIILWKSYVSRNPSSSFLPSKEVRPKTSQVINRRLSTQAIAYINRNPSSSFCLPSRYGPKQAKVINRRLSTQAIAFI